MKSGSKSEHGIGGFEFVAPVPSSGYKLLVGGEAIYLTHKAGFTFVDIHLPEPSPEPPQPWPTPLPETFPWHTTGIGTTYCTILMWLRPGDTIPMPVILWEYQPVVRILDGEVITADDWDHSLAYALAASLPGQIVDAWVEMPGQES